MVSRSFKTFDYATLEFHRQGLRLHGRRQSSSHQRLSSRPLQQRMLLLVAELIDLELWERPMGFQKLALSHSRTMWADNGRKRCVDLRDGIHNNRRRSSSRAGTGRTRMSVAATTRLLNCRNAQRHFNELKLNNKLRELATLETHRGRHHVVLNFFYVVFSFSLSVIVFAPGLFLTGSHEKGERRGGGGVMMKQYCAFLFQDKKNVVLFPGSLHLIEGHDVRPTVGKTKTASTSPPSSLLIFFLQDCNLLLQKYA